MRPASIWLLAVVALSLVLLGACGDSEPEPSPSLEPGPIPTAALAPEPTETPVPDPTATPEPTSTPSPEAIPSTPRLVERSSRTDLVGTVESAPCRYIEFSSAFPEYPAPAAECGYLTVLEDRSKPSGPTIRIHYAVFQSFSESPLPDPVVYLEGGPGGHALQSGPAGLRGLGGAFPVRAGLHHVRPARSRVLRAGPGLSRTGRAGVRDAGP